MRFAAAFLGSLAVTISLARPPVTTAILASEQCGPDPYVSICIANNYVHTVYSGANLRSDIKADMYWVLDYTYDDDTELLALPDSDTNTDVKAYSTNYGQTGYYAATYCPTSSSKYGTNPNVVCRPQVIRFNLYYSSRYDTQWERRAFACHEIGHTVGLHHENNLDSCLEAVPYVDTLSQIDVYEINQKYYPY